MTRFNVTRKGAARSLWAYIQCVPKHTATRLVFCYQRNAAFRPLILHRFRPFLKQQTWISFRMRTPVKNFRISAQEFSTSQKLPKIRYSRVRCCDRAAAQSAYYCGRWESFQGLVHIPRMSLVGGLRLGAISPRKSWNFAEFSTWADLIV